MISPPLGIDDKSRIIELKGVKEIFPKLAVLRLVLVWVLQRNQRRDRS